MTADPESSNCTPVVVYGCGGHGKVVADILLTRHEEVRGFLDDGVASGSRVMGLAVLGSFEWLRTAAQGLVSVALGIGDNDTRERVARRCVDAGFKVVSAIHPSAVIAASAQIGRGTVVMAMAVINPDAAVGAGAIINSGAVVEHDCVVGEYAHLSPNSAMGGGARIGRLSHLGLGAVVLPGVAVGEASTVGAGAVVVRDVPDRVVAFGIPARIRTRSGSSQ